MIFLTKGVEDVSFVLLFNKSIFFYLELKEKSISKILFNVIPEIKMYMQIA